MYSVKCRLYSVYSIVSIVSCNSKALVSRPYETSPRNTLADPWGARRRLLGSRRTSHGSARSARVPWWRVSRSKTIWEAHFCNVRISTFESRLMKPVPKAYCQKVCNPMPCYHVLTKLVRGTRSQTHGERTGAFWGAGALPMALLARQEAPRVCEAGPWQHGTRTFYKVCKRTP